MRVHSLAGGLFLAALAANGPAVGQGSLQSGSSAMDQPAADLPLTPASGPSLGGPSAAGPDESARGGGVNLQMQNDGTRPDEGSGLRFFGQDPAAVPSLLGGGEGAPSLLGQP